MVTIYSDEHYTLTCPNCHRGLVHQKHIESNLRNPWPFGDRILEDTRRTAQALIKSKEMYLPFRYQTLENPTSRIHPRCMITIKFRKTRIYSEVDEVAEGCCCYCGGKLEGAPVDVPASVMELNGAAAQKSSILFSPSHPLKI